MEQASSSNSFEAVAMYHGTKQLKAKGRFTLFVCTNGDGLHSLPLSITGSAKKPKCFRGKGFSSNISTRARPGEWECVPTVV
jgi:hypothetical protein